MRLVYLGANSAHAFILGDQLVRLDGWSMFFLSRSEALGAARQAGLRVDSRGRVEVA